MYKYLIVIPWLFLAFAENLVANEKVSFIGPEEDYVSYNKLQIETLNGDTFLFETDKGSGNLERIFSIINGVKSDVPKLVLNKIYYPDLQTVEILSNTINNKKYYILRLIFMEYREKDELIVNSSEVIEYQLRLKWLYDKEMLFDVEIINKDKNLLLMKWSN